MKTVFYLILVLLEFITATLYWLPVRVLWGKNTFDYVIEYASFKDWFNKHIAPRE